MLRIVRVSERVTPAPGGREVHVRELSRRQALSGHDVRLLYRVGGEDGWPFESSCLVGTWRVPAGIPHQLLTPVFLAASLAVIARNGRKTDVVHFHGDYLEAVAAGALRLMGVPTLLTLHARLSPRVLRTLGFVYRLPSHVVAVSSSIAAQLEGVGVSRPRITVQHSGVDRDLFFPTDHVPPRPPLRVVVGSSLIPRKGHVSLFEAVRHLRRRGIAVRIEIAGTGPERAHLERSAPPGTLFHGQLDRPALADLMRSSHVAALASVDVGETGEGTPTFLMEAVACGLPFVATDTGGVPELATRSGAGVIVPQREPHALAAALEILATDATVYEERRHAAIAFAPALDWRRVATRVEALFESLCKPAGP
jgi:glycosyltransferase involved in cell wall biosynthesis